MRDENRVYLLKEFAAHFLRLLLQPFELEFPFYVDTFGHLQAIVSLKQLLKLFGAEVLGDLLG